MAEPDSLREVRIDPVTPEAVRLWSMTLALACSALSSLSAGNRAGREEEQPPGCGVRVYGVQEAGESVAEGAVILVGVAGCGDSRGELSGGALGLAVHMRDEQAGRSPNCW